MFDINAKLDEAKAKNMNPIVLAYIGDAVYSLYARERLAFASDIKVSQLHKQVNSEVRASAQAELIERLLPVLTEAECDVYRRARNAKKGTKAKSASVAEYNRSTGFEALLGYLYISGQTDRLNYLLNLNEKEDKQ